MLEAVGGTVLASRVALERGWAINLGGGFHHASASGGSQGTHNSTAAARREHGLNRWCFHTGCIFNDVSLAIKHVRQNERGRVTKVLIVDLVSSPGTGSLFLDWQPPSCHVLIKFRADFFRRRIGS
jgi:histone deacetylase 11